MSKNKFVSLVMLCLGFASVQAQTLSDLAEAQRIKQGSSAAPSVKATETTPVVKAPPVVRITPVLYSIYGPKGSLKAESILGGRVMPLSVGTQVGKAKVVAIRESGVDFAVGKAKCRKKGKCRSNVKSLSIGDHLNF